MSTETLQRQLVDPASTPEEVRSALSHTEGAGQAWRWESRLRWALLLLDAVLLLVALGVGTIVDGRYPLGPALIFVVCWQGMLALSGAYAPRHLGPGSREFGRVVNASLRIWLAVLVLEYAVSSTTARPIVLVTAPVGVALLLLGRIGVRSVLSSLRRRNACRQRVLAVGTVRDVLHLAEESRRTPAAGFDIAGACIPAHPGPDRRARDRRDDEAPAVAALRAAEPDRRADVTELLDRGIPVLGGAGEVLSAIRLTGADTVAVAGPGIMSRQALRRLAWQLEGSNVRLFVASALSEVAAPRLTLRPLGGLPLLHVETPAFGGLRPLLKGMLDRALSALILLAASPMLVALAVAIKLDSRGPVLYRQERVGRNGQPFQCLKLRTMRVGADKEVAALAARNESDAVLFKIREDPRVTRVGRVLRRYSLDELPQLLNVLGGTMSLVGPRPPLPTEAAEYGSEVRRRLLVKPGMTGLWQVSGRSDLSWAESVRLDLYYVENWSPIFDLTLMARTVTAVAKGRGAY